MKTFTQQGAAQELGIRPSTIRSAISRGHLVVREDSAKQSVITEWELERYRHRRDNFSLSLHLMEISEAETPLPTILQTSLSSNVGLESQAKTLMRLYRLPESAGASAVVVLGDLQHFSPTTRRDNLKALITTARAEVAAALDGYDDPTNVIWVTLGGFLGESAARFTDINVIGVAEDPNGVRIHAVDQSTLGVLEDRLGQLVLTWPAVHPHDFLQAHQWDLACIGRLDDNVWRIDPHAGAATLTALRAVNQAAGDNEDKKSVVAMLSSLLVTPVLSTAVRPGPLPLPASVIERLAVQVLTWRPTDTDTAFVRDLAAGWPDDDYRPVDHPEVCAAAMDWLRSVDPYSPSPAPQIAGPLRGLLDGLALGFELPGLPPSEYSVMPLGITGDVGKRWLKSLNPAPPARHDNSEHSRQRRALDAVLTSLDASDGYSGDVMVDSAGVLAVQADIVPSDQDGRILVVRPTSPAALPFPGETVTAQGEAGGDLAVFVTLVDRSYGLTLLPHVASGGVNWGYNGSGPRDAAEDIAAAHAHRHGLEAPDPGFKRKVAAHLCQQGLTEFTINLYNGHID